jgi:hypothetical protein
MLDSAGRSVAPSVHLGFVKAIAGAKVAATAAVAAKESLAPDGDAEPQNARLVALRSCVRRAKAGADVAERHALHAVARQLCSPSEVVSSAEAILATMELRLPTPATAALSDVVADRLMELGDSCLSGDVDSFADDHLSRLQLRLQGIAAGVETLAPAAASLAASSLPAQATAQRLPRLGDAAARSASLLQSWLARKQ